MLSFEYAARALFIPPPARAPPPHRRRPGFLARSDVPEPVGLINALSQQQVHIFEEKPSAILHRDLDGRRPVGFRLAQDVEK